MLLGVVVSFRFEDATPMSAAPRIWTIVATTSQVMKIQRMSLGLTARYISMRTPELIE
jgi:hypothetical protein